MITESLRTCLRRLPDQQRHIIEGLFWEERTEVEVALMLSLSQSAISKRKRSILDQLRHWMDGPERDEDFKKIEE